MAIERKEVFIEKFLRPIKKELEENLPAEGPVFELQEEAWKLLVQKAKHVTRLY